MRLSFLVPLLASAAISSAAMASDDQQSGQQHRWQRSSQASSTTSSDSPRSERSGWGHSRGGSSDGGQATAGVERSSARPDRSSGGWGGRDRGSATAQGSVSNDNVTTTTTSDSGFQSRLQAYRQSHDRTGSAWSGKDRTTSTTTDTVRSSHHSGGSRYNWSSTDWRRDGRYDWNRYRDRHRSIFRLGIYYDPYGYNYRRFDIGYSMWPNYYQSSYWIQDPWMYRLPPVYGPYRWVRYWDDALLVDTWTGEVVDVIHNFFW